MAYYLRAPRVRRRRTMSFSDGLVRSRVRPSGLPHGETGWRPPERLALAAAEGVVDRVHGHATGLGADALPAVAAGLADADQLGLGVADLAEGGPAVDRHPAHLGGGQAQGGVVALLGDELDAHAGAAGDLAAAAGLELDVVDDRADRDVAHRQGVAGPDVGALAALQHVADLSPGPGPGCSASRRRGSAAGRCGRCGWGRTRWPPPWPARRPWCA